MADFAKWVCASETAIGWEGNRFLDAYQGNRQDANATAIEASEIGQPLLDYLQAHGAFAGTATDLLEALDQEADEGTRKQRQAKNSGWPKSARGILESFADWRPISGSWGTKSNWICRTGHLDWVRKQPSRP